MKKILIITLLILSTSFATVNAEINPGTCFDMGFSSAVKAYNAGDKTMFDYTTGPSMKAYKQSPCCKDYGNNQLGCMGYMAAFKAVLLGGPSKNNHYYREQYQMVKMLQLGF